MNTIIDYQLVEQLYESQRSLVYRAKLQPHKKTAIVKILKEKYPTPSELTQYKQEYEITHSLNSENIIQALDLQRYENSMAIFLEDFGGKSLSQAIVAQKLPLEDCLKIAIAITEGLADIHANNIIHKDINSSNIIYNPETGQVKIIDFGIATRLPRENQTTQNLARLEGTLTYISPEQTGRMNRGIDYRSDFYSFGVTFYQLLTSTLPFDSNDPLELVHCHIAQNPKPPYELQPSIPLAISNIVMKLLEKAPEERYQSAWGLKADLEICLDSLQSGGQISVFPLGKKDICERFYIPERLYGREREVTDLLDTFERVSQGATEMMLVSGYSGIGKSALVNEIQKPIVRQRGYFVSGKFDQFKRNIPYEAIVKAFQNLIRQLLAESETKLKNWREQILIALGTNGQVILEIIPELEQIIGVQPPVPQLNPIEAQNRFSIVFQRFISVFSTKNNPLVIFLDDLQWADIPSLQLIELLMTDPDRQYFLVIGSYRDNEVNSTHSLIHTIEQIKKTGVIVSNIVLQPLGIEQINKLIADTLNCSSQKSSSLAELIQEKTGGNPFFLIQLLQSLYQEKFFLFDSDSKYWQWDIEEIRKIGITDNVIDLMIDKIEKLNRETQENLKIASCINNQFSLEVLSSVNGKSQIHTARVIQSAIEEGLIFPLSKDHQIPLLWNIEETEYNSINNNSALIAQSLKSISYKFLHDRVQQASYALLQEQERKQIHLQIGHILLEYAKDEELEEYIFDIVNHLNVSNELISKHADRNSLAKLNLQAGRKAKVAAAYQPALKYFSVGLDLLLENSWECEYELTLDLHLEHLEALLLNTKFEEVETYSEIILQQAPDILDKVKVYQIKIQLYRVQFDYQKSLDTSLEILNELGVKISQTNQQSLDRMIRLSLKSILEKKKIKDLVNLPAMTNPYKLAISKLIQSILMTAWTINFPVCVKLVLTQIDIAIEFGNSPESPCIYAHYAGILLSGVIRDIDSAYQFGQVSLKLLEKANSFKSESELMHIYYGWIWHFKKFLGEEVTQKKILEGIQRGVDIGTHEQTSMISMDYCLIRFFSGYDLEIVEQDYRRYSNLIERLKQQYSLNYIAVCQKIASKIIQGYSHKLCVLAGNSQDEEKQSLQNWESNYWLLFITYLGKTIAYYIFKDFQCAFDSARNADRSVQPVQAFILEPQHYFYLSLSLLAYCLNYETEQQEQLLETVNKNQKKMKMWAYHCQENFQHKYDIVEAEKARILGNHWQAEELYEKAIQGAKQYNFIHEEAISYERAAEFYFALNRQEIGALYLRNAHHCYSRWGAKAKVKQLEEEYPQLLLETSLRTSTQTTIDTISTTGSSHAEVLDLGTVIKASQALAGEIQLDKLLEQLMSIAIENAGAQKGILILDSNHNWVVEAQKTLDSKETTTLQSIPIDSPDSELSPAIANYVLHSQETVVLNNAVNEGQYTRDPYIVTNQPKSILCIPLINQGKLSGILYLENNLTTNAFTNDRVELLQTLSAQAAIAIENARLYDQLEEYNKTLEEKVKERTAELSNTVKVLEQTQAELKLENALLKSDEQADSFDYQIGGSLNVDAPTYVVRSADRHLYQAMRQGQFCYTFNARQMGKSSLMVRIMNGLWKEGYRCISIDLTGVGGENTTSDQWYKGIAVEMWRKFKLLRKFKLTPWWKELTDIPAPQRLKQFIEEVVLTEVKKEDSDEPANIVIFIDEIDCILSLPFPVNDFFALIRSCYNQRAIDPIYDRLTFALFGSATPSTLIADPKKTPFNIGRPIHLEGFKVNEAQPLLYGLTVNNPQTVLKAIIDWTGGQPFLTQKVCSLIRSANTEIPPNGEEQWIADLVAENILKNWEAKDDPEHLKTVRDRILKSDRRQELLSIYQQIVLEGEAPATYSETEKELLLSGLAIAREGILKVNNRIYQSIFDRHWLERQLSANT